MQEKLGSGADGRMVLSWTLNAPVFTSEKKALCDMKFVKWLVRKSRALTMGRQDDELNEFIEEVTDGAYTLPCYEVILKLVKQMQAWGDARIKKIVQVLAAEGIKISMLRTSKRPSVSLTEASASCTHLSWSCVNSWRMTL